MEGQTMTIRVDFDDRLTEKAGASGTDVSATTVHGALFAVAREFPIFHMFNCDGELRGILKVERNGEPTTVTQSLSGGDRLRLYLGS